MSSTTDRRNLALLIATVHDGRPRYQIAAAAHVNATLFSGIVTGRVQPSDAVKERIAAALGMTVDELFNGDEVEP